jgi:iron complex outermembrane receptor protein
MIGKDDAMRTIDVYSSVAASLALALGLAGPATIAQGATAEAATVLEEIVVTAQKRVEKLQDVPIAITVVDQTQLADQHVYTIADLARTTPALEMVQAFGGPGGGGQIRGIGTQSFTRSAEGAVGIVVDGVPQGNVNTNNIFDMQRVEVLRGPQGTLFGLTSSAGVINMLTVAPDPGRIESRVHLDYSNDGSAGSRFGQQTLRALVNLPLSADSALRISATADRLNGVQYNALTGQKNAANDYGVRARYLWKGSDRLTVNLIADYDKRTQNYADPQFTYIDANAALTAELAACGITPGFANQAHCGSLPNDNVTRNYGISVQVDAELNGPTLTSITALRKNQVGPSDADIQGLAAEFVQIFTLGFKNAGRQFSEELRIASPGRQTVDYVAGLFYSDYLASTGYAPGGVDNVGSFQAGPGFTPFAQDDTATRTTNRATAAFGQLTYHLSDALGLIAGLRYTHQNITDFTTANSYDPTTFVTYGAIQQSNVSGRVGLQYRISPALSTYATAVRGYKGPQVTPAMLGVAATVIAPEIPTAFELGIKGAVLNDSVAVDFNVFSSRVRDYQGQRCFIAPVGALTCNGESIPAVTTKGAELDIFGRPAHGLTLSGGVIYDVAQYPSGWTGYDPNNLNGGTTDLSELQLVGVPKIKVTFSGEYTVPLPRFDLVVAADTVYKSALRLGPSADPRFVYPAHWTTGAHLGIQSHDSRRSASLYVRNLSNDHEPVTIFGGPSFTMPDPTVPTNGYVNGISGWVSPASLRQVGLSVELQW